MPSKPESAQVFLSYATTDRERALAVGDALEAAGVSVWIDRRAIAGGDLWAAGIAQAIRQCAVVVVLCSQASVNSRNVRQELQLAWDFDRPILPVILEPISFPDETAYFLHGRQWIELLDQPDSTGVEAIASALASISVPASDFNTRSRPEPMRFAPIKASRRELPTPPTPLIGRDKEAAAITALIREHAARFVTLTGPGGVGKTRLAIEVAGLMSIDFPDAVVFVDLASLTESDQVLPAIAGAVGLRDTGDRSLLEVLIGFFGARRNLLLLDNFEHLLPAAPAVAALGRDCPNLQLVITSREPLRVRGEREVQVAPLPVPSVGEPIPLAELNANESTLLFVSRAQDVRPDFLLSESNALHIAEICRQLDGLPLAIELAAARIRLLSPANLLDRLAQQLGFLTEGARDAPARQQTLRSTISWSYDLLSTAEQMFLRRMSVFVNGCTLDGALEMATIPGADPFDVVTSLVEKSLLRTSQTPEGETRFSMLVSIRAFGLEQLEARHEVDTARQMQLRYVLAMLKAFGPDGSIAGLGERWLRRMDVEFANVWSAFNWAEQTNDNESLLRIGVEIANYWTTRPYTREALSTVADGIENAADGPANLQVMSRFYVGVLMGSIGEQPHAFELAETALRIAEADSDRALQGQVHLLMGVLWEAAGDCERSVQSLRTAIAALTPPPDSFWFYTAMGELGDRLVVCGDSDEAVATLAVADTGYRAYQSQWGVAILAGQRGHAEIRRGQIDLARRLFAESIEGSRAIGDLRLELGAVMGLASIELEAGHLEQAASIIGLAQRERELHGIGRTLAHPLENQRTIARVREALGEESFRASVEVGRALTYHQALPSLLSTS